MGGDRRFLFIFACDRAIFSLQNSSGGVEMKEPGLDARHRDNTPPKSGEIQLKRSDTLNGNLDRPISHFRSDATLGAMRKETGKVSEEAVRGAARILRPDKG
jgi:hypothetical protein